MAGLPTPIVPAQPVRRHPFPGFGGRRTVDIASAGSYSTFNITGLDVIGGGGGEITGIPTPPNDGNIYGMQGGQWVNISHSIASIAQGIADGIVQTVTDTIIQQVQDQLSQSLALITTSILSQAKIGVTDGSDAVLGNIGEFVTIGNIITMPVTTGVNYNVIGTLNLTAGDWDVFSNLYNYTNNVVGGNNFWICMCPSSLPLASTDPARPADNVAWMGSSYGANPMPLAIGDTIGPIRMSSGGNTGVDLRATCDATSGTVSIYWAISARRIR